MELNEFEKNMSAVAFAEAGEHETAQQILAGNGSELADTRTVVRKKPVMKMVIFGALSLSLYAILLSQQDLITETFTRGGVNAAWPVGTAFVFSFIHGAFASNFLSVLGIEAKK